MAEDVGVDQGRRHVAVAEELLDSAEVMTALRKVGREGMAEGVATGALVDAGRADGEGHRALHIRLMVVMPAFGRLAFPPCGAGKIHCQRSVVSRFKRDRTPIAGRSGKLSVDRIRQPDAPETRGPVFLVQRCRKDELLAQLRVDVRGKHGHAVVLPFRIADGDLTAGEVDVLDTQRKDLQQAQPGAVQLDDQPARFFDGVDDAPNSSTVSTTGRGCGRCARSGRSAKAAGPPGRICTAGQTPSRFINQISDAQLDGAAWSSAGAGARPRDKASWAAANTSVMRRYHRKCVALPAPLWQVRAGDDPHHRSRRGPAP